MNKKTSLISLYPFTLPNHQYHYTPYIFMCDALVLGERNKKLIFGYSYHKALLIIIKFKGIILS